MNERDRKILLKILQYIDEIQFTIKELNLEEIPQDERALLEEYYNDMKKELDISVSISINDLLER